MTVQVQDPPLPRLLKRRRAWTNVISIRRSCREIRRPWNANFDRGLNGMRLRPGQTIVSSTLVPSLTLMVPRHVQVCSSSQDRGNLERPIAGLHHAEIDPAAKSDTRRMARGLKPMGAFPSPFPARPDTRPRESRRWIPAELECDGDPVGARVTAHLGHRPQLLEDLRVGRV